MKCVKCSGKCDKAVVQKVYAGKIVVSGVEVLKCKKCGAELLEEKEYEKVRKRIHEVENKIPQAVLAKVRLLIL